MICSFVMVRDGLHQEKEVLNSKISSQYLWYCSVLAFHLLTSSPGGRFCSLCTVHAFITPALWLHHFRITIQPCNLCVKEMWNISLYVHSWRPAILSNIEVTWKYSATCCNYCAGAIQINHRLNPLHVISLLNDWSTSIGCQVSSVTLGTKSVTYKHKYSKGTICCKGFDGCPC